MALPLAEVVQRPHRKARGGTKANTGATPGNVVMIDHLRVAVAKPGYQLRDFPTQNLASILVEGMLLIRETEFAARGTASNDSASKQSTIMSNQGSIMVAQP